MGWMKTKVMTGAAANALTGVGAGQDLVELAWGEGAAIFDLDKPQLATAGDDQVNLTIRAAVAPCHHTITLKIEQ